MARKNKYQYLYATESTHKFSYKLAKSFFKDVQKENKKGIYQEKGIKQRITRTNKLLQEAISFKGSKKEKKLKQEKFLSSFKRLADKDYFDYDPKTNSMRRRQVIKREWISGKQTFSRIRKFRVGRKSSYKFSGDVFDYESFKNKFNNYDEHEKQKILNYKVSFVSGKYSRWSTAVKTILGIDASVSPATLKKWLDDYEKGV